MLKLNISAVAGRGQCLTARELMEIVFLVSNYTLMAMATNSFGIPPEERFKNR